MAGSRTEAEFLRDGSRFTAADVREAVYKIAEAASTVKDLPALFSSIHQIVAGLMPARNLFIALVDDTGTQISFPYYVDELDTPPSPQFRPMGRENGITEYVVRTRAPLLLGLGEARKRAEQGDFSLLGRESTAWLGVPLVIEDRIIGVLAVQSYSERDRYTTEDLDVLSYVSRQVTSAIHRRRTEEQLAESTRRLVALINNLPGVVYRCRNDADWTMEYLSEGVRELTGFSAIDLIGNRTLSYASIIDPTDREAVWSWTQDGLAARCPYTMEYRIRTATGQEKWVWERGSGVFADDRLLELQGFMIDITERRRADAERADLETQLRHSQRIESVGMLAGGIAHDLNNLLVPVLGYMEMLPDEVGTNPGAQEMIGHVQAAAERARDLVKQLLAFSRRQVLKLRIVDLGEVIAGFQPILRRTIREDITIEVAASEEPAFVRADPIQVEQVLMNLAVNAQDAMIAPPARGGTLSIATRCSEGQVILSVQDTGMGMDEETIGHVFEPFFTTKEPGQGTGLGLSTVYGIVKQHGWEITVRSRPNEGTEFRITLPRVAPPEPEALVSEPMRCVKGACTETVLFVEDEQSVRELGKDMLTKEGYRVIACSCAEEAIAAARTHKDAIAVLVTDVIMPGTNGKELAVALSRERPGLRVLFTSGYTDEVIAVHGVLEDGVHFIAKPYSARLLAAKVRAVIDDVE
jgi:two-component system cell cycle sensor histidine kinase/response regulator CckA